MRSRSRSKFPNTILAERILEGNIPLTYFIVSTPLRASGADLVVWHFRNIKGYCTISECMVNFYYRSYFNLKQKRKRYLRGAFTRIYQPCWSMMFYWISKIVWPGAALKFNRRITEVWVDHKAKNLYYKLTAIVRIGNNATNRTDVK